MRINRFLLPAIVWIILILFPLFSGQIQGGSYYLVLVTRLLIFALAASSLNLVLGYGGMVSFGHAAYFGMAGYIVAILATSNSIISVWISWPLAMLFAGLLALVIGGISLRTRGVYFIMITLAFAQMLFFLMTALRQYGGTDGLRMPRSDLGFGFDLENDVTLYYVALAILALVLFILYRLINSRFGRVIQGIKENETRTASIGFPVYRYQLIAFVISGALTGLAGVLNANLNSFISPNSLAWSQSGSLMIMVILGGLGRFWGGMIGAFAFLLLESVLENYTIHWPLGVGIALLIVVLFAPQGLSGLRLFGKQTP
jgi:branched-chain amino acid transport system permease protein